MINLTENMVVKHGIVISLDENDRIFNDGAIVIQDGRILEVDKTSRIEKKYKADEVIDARGKVVLPGLINTHMHSESIRGIGDDLPLYEWLESYVHPEHKATRPEDAYAMSRLGYCESIKSGTTCLLDMHRFMDRCADAAEEIGIRAVLAPYVSDQINYLEKFEDNKKLIKKRHGSCNGRIMVWCGLHHWRDCSPELLKKARECADKYGVGIHTHTNESIRDVELAKKRYGKKPIEHLHEFGITGPDVVLAHCVWLSKKEIKILEETKTRVAHCPVSNMKLADGIAPIPTFLSRGIGVGLGTDGSKECNSFDMFEVMKFTALLHTVNQLDTTVMPSEKVLRMATRGGAQALGLEKELGSLEKGKRADLIVVNLTKLHLTPILYEPFNVISHLVYAARGSDVETVIVDGKVVMENRIIKNVDESEVIRTATERSKKLLERIQR